MKRLIRSILKMVLYPLIHNKKLYFYIQENFFTGSSDFLFRLLLHTKNIPEAGIIIDIGAANGDVSKFFLEHYPKVEKVVAFEPNLKMRPYLNKIKDKRFELIEKGLSENPGFMTLNVTENNLSSSLYDIDSKYTMGHLKDSLAIVSKNEIEITTLDTYLNQDTPVFILKLDTQGAELDILKGGIKTLKNTKFIVSEVQNHKIYKGACQYYDIDQFLREQNFELIDIIAYYRNPNRKLDEFDMIYKNKGLF